MNGSGIVLVRNKHAGPAVFMDDFNGQRIPYEWKGYGDPNQDDYQELPDHVTQVPSFRKAVQRGVFEITDLEEDTRAPMNSGQSWQDQQAQAQAAIESVMDRPSDRDIRAVACVGPGVSVREACGAAVIVRSEDKDKTPLCPSHEHLAHQYAKVQGESGEKWIKA